jgi:hypothetical protein
VRVLITNNSLADRAGTELYVRDIALRLKEAGHTPVCFSLRCGEVAQELQDGGVQVVSFLSEKHGPFALIHGHHRIETTLAAMAFPRTPVVSFCHGPKAWPERPAFLPNVVHYAAVDEACRARLIEEGVPPEQITLLLNFADTRRFTPRPPLPSVPRTALVFSNRASEQTHLPLLRKACEACGISMEVIGQDSGRLADRPEDLLPHYDIVFAKARAAIEAMAVGCAVIQCDYFGAGGLITTARFDAIRPLNFGYLSMTEPLEIEYLCGQIRAYDPVDAASVSRRIRGEASLDSAFPKLLALYDRIAATPCPDFDPWEAGEEFLQKLVTDAKEAASRLPGLVEKVRDLQGKIATLEATHASRMDELQRGTVALEQENQSLREERETLTAALKRAQRPWWRRLSHR